MEGPGVLGSAALWPPRRAFLRPLEPLGSGGVKREKPLLPDRLKLSLEPLLLPRLPRLRLFDFRLPLELF